MSRRLLCLPLCAALPALLCAQEPKLTNCRTLEAAGNFVGPDEVIVNDLVCQKAKSGEGESKVLVKNEVDRDTQFLYFIDKEGDVSRSPRGSRKTAEKDTGQERKAA